MLSTRDRRLAPPLKSSLHGVKLLRMLRDRLIRDGNHAAALGKAIEVAHRDPCRESFFRLGFLYRETGRYREALKAFRDALRFKTGPLDLISEIHLHKAYTWFLMGRRKRMGECLRRAYAQPIKPRSGFNLHMSLGAFFFARQKFREALEQYQFAERLASTTVLKSSAAANQGAALIRLQCRAEAGDALDRAIRLQKAGNHKAKLAMTRMMRAALHLDEGQMERALAIFLRAAQSFRRLGQRDLEAVALKNAGYAAAESEDWPLCRRTLDSAIRLASRLGNRHLQICAHAIRALALAHEESFEHSRLDLLRSRELLRGRRNPLGVLHVSRVEARLAEFFGRWPDMARSARHGERVASRLRDWPRVIEFRKLRAVAEQSMGRRRAAVLAWKSTARLTSILAGVSPVMRRVRQEAARLTTSKLSILITGETGVGKSDLARALHLAGPRARGPLVIVPCENIVLPQSELCGHARGAWSGADRNRLGLIRRAQGGTLVLDRADELSEEAQRVLYRVLDGRLRDVDSGLEEAIDVRFIATCRDPENLIPGSRRKLAGAVVHLPPLRERREEIRDLVELYLRGRRSITGDALARLSAHPWPGNLAELRAMLDQLVVKSDGVIGGRLVSRILNAPDSYRLRGRVDNLRHLRKMASALA